ncbi:unnamed protein product [Clonostachys chloroleuca]|uniref:FAD dependent oxidoreductase domain-containing protein n=1 Tax=Clonostachys chloroleuca TaxID=1926264 RepID=A0AA35Q990_9HYPO|nr:unnamed protein product [Clonostachys chloroleuca]
MTSTKPRQIIIVGAGIFGLSTAIHLARRGYTNIAVFDKQPYEKTLYSYLNGCDAASADINKIIRSAYGSQTIYQDLTSDALRSWHEWNQDIARGADLPPGLSPSDRVFVNCGNLSCGDYSSLPTFERDTVECMEAAGFKGTQLITNEPADLDAAKEKGFLTAMNPFSKETLGILDTTGGIAVADKACLYALHKAKSLGVRFIMDPLNGAFASFIYDANSQVIGIRTADDKKHLAEMTIMACGGWTPSLLPELDGLCEATAGSVVLLKIPESSHLRQRFSPSRFPSYTFKVRDGAEGGLYGFPVDDQGLLKIGYRGTKYTNPKVQKDGKERSVPVTRWTSGKEGTLTQIPQQAHRVIRKFLDEYLPELSQEGIDIWKSRVCWYTDSFDNHFVIDRVPGQKGLMCATGGSGHAFKFLPNIGKWVVDVMEGIGMDNPVIQAWRWRKAAPGEKPTNKLMEGSEGARSLGKICLVTAETRRSKL